jgi:serine/threonine-protein kinase
MSPQQSIAHYRITAKLGEGGMGAVYRATDTKLNREVAIKILPDALAADPDYLARFTREAQVLAALNHPHIAAIYGVEDRAIVMELVEGRDLPTPLPLDDALPIARQIAEALEAAHEKGIVHRDLKPANIKLTPDGKVKVLDFGLAKSIEPTVSTAPNSPTLTLRATQAGVIMGTAAYMAPEQARGKVVDKRADIWAFGVVLYEMLTGRQLFGGDTVTDILASVVKDAPDLNALPAATPPHIRRLLSRCLQKDATRRLRDIGEARIALDEPTESPAPPSPPATAATRPYGWIVATAILGLIASVSGLLAWRATRSNPRPLVRLNVDLGADALPSLRNMATLSPDGSRVLYLARSGDKSYALALRFLDQERLAVLPGTEGASSPSFSPDGQWVAFQAGGKLKKTSINGGNPVVLCDLSGAVWGTTWSGDGRIAFGADGSGLRIVAASGGASREITNPSASGHAVHRFPQFLPGDHRLLFTAHSSTGDFDNAEVAAVDLDTNAVKVVVKGGYYGRYLPSGHVLFVRNGSILGSKFDPSRLAAEGEPQPLIEEVAGSSIVGSGRFSFTVDGTFVYMAGRTSLSSAPLVWLQPAGNSQPVLPLTARYSTPVVSPDGRSMAFSMGPVGATDLHVWDFRREIMTRLTTGAQGNAFPVWTPDGKRLIYASSSAGKFALWTRRVDGAGEPVKLAEAPGELMPSSVSPDGKRVAYSAAGGAAFDDLYTLPLDWSDPEHPKAGAPELFLRTPAVDLAPFFSPDGRWIAYTSNESGRHEAYVRPFPGPGAKWQVSAAGGVFPQWSPSGRQIYFVATDNRMMIADVDTKGGEFSSGKPRLWSETRLGTAPRWTTFNIAPDGKVIAFVPEDATAVSRLFTHATFLLNFFDELKRRLP